MSSRPPGQRTAGPVNPDGSGIHVTFFYGIPMILALFSYESPRNCLWLSYGIPVILALFPYDSPRIRL